MGEMIDLIEAGKFAIPILYLDNHLLVAVKPPNLLAQSDASGDADMLSILKKYVAATFHKPGEAYLGLLHRLDRPVGGVMVFARTSKAAARLSADFAAHRVDKRYLAVVEGILPGPAEFEDMLLQDPRTGMVRRADASSLPSPLGKVPPLGRMRSSPDPCDSATDASGKLARLLTEPIATLAVAGGEATLTRVTLYTGRPHQIRVQHALRGHPVWGDCRYGHGVPGQQIALWAAELTLTHPTQKTVLRFETPPPMTEPFARYRVQWEEKQ